MDYSKVIMFKEMGPTFPSNLHLHIIKDKAKERRRTTPT